MKKKTKKETYNKAIFWIVISIIFLVFIISVGAYEVLTNTDFRVSSRVSKLNKRQKNNKAEKKTVGWLRVQGTNIDFPIIYAPDYNFVYETEDFGWTETDFKELNNMIYISGHNIKNLAVKPALLDKDHTRFEQLMSFAYYDFAKENQFIQYTFNGEDYVYRIFAVNYMNESDLDLYNDKKYTDKEMHDEIERIRKNSLYKYNTDVDESDKVIILTTCTNMFGESSDTHFLVSGRLMRRNEGIKKVKVETTGEYDIIQEQMKGGESYDEA